MRLNRYHKFIFLSNPKSGSTSVRLWLDSICECECEREKPEWKLHGDEQHYKKLFGSSLIYFTTIRNPWAKVVSHYFYDKPDKNCVAVWQPDYTGEGLLSFDEYVIRHNRLRKLHIRKFAPTARLFKIEEISSLAEFVGELMNKETLPPIQHLNTTEHKHYSEYYNDKTRDLVGRIFNSDIILGNYKF